MKVVIIGGVAGGATGCGKAAPLMSRQKSLYWSAAATSPMPTAACLLHWRGDHRQGGAHPATPASFWARFRIEVRVHNEVTAIHPERKKRYRASP